VTARLHVICLQSWVPRADHSEALMPLSAAPPPPTYQMLIHYRWRRLPSWVTAKYRIAQGVQKAYCPIPNITRYRRISPNTQYPDTGIVRTLLIYLFISTWYLALRGVQFVHSSTWLHSSFFSLKLLFSKYALFCIAVQCELHMTSLKLNWNYRIFVAFHLYEWEPALQ